MRFSFYTACPSVLGLHNHKLNPTHDSGKHFDTRTNNNQLSHKPAQSENRFKIWPRSPFWKFFHSENLSWQDNRCIKCALSILRAHFYLISFTKSDCSIISTTFNAVEGSLRHQDYQAYLAYMKWGLHVKLTWIWLTFSAVMISTPDRLLIACCIDQRAKKKTTSWWLKSFLVLLVARCRRIQFLGEFLPNESEGDSRDRFGLPHAVLAHWSFLRVTFLQIPLLKINIPFPNNLGEFKPIATKWPTVFHESSHLSNVAVNRQNQRILVTYVMYGCIVGLPLAKPLTLVVLSQNPTGL